MKLIRKNTFETNSSSTHSICICSEEDYEKFEAGELLFDTWNDEFVERDDKNNTPGNNYVTCDEYFDDEYLESFYEPFTLTKTLPTGEVIDINGVAFGRYGID